MRRVLIAALLAGCVAPAPPDAPAAGPFVVLKPPLAAKPHAVATPPGDSTAAVARDTAALRDQAAQYVVRGDSKTQVIDRLAVLVAQSRRAVDRLRHRHGLADVTAARVAADALAGYIATQAKDQ